MILLLVIEQQLLFLRGIDGKREKNIWAMRGRQQKYWQSSQHILFLKKYEDKDFFLFAGLHKTLYHIIFK